MSLLQIWTEPPMLALIALVIGLIFGGFATVAADRLGQQARMEDRLGDILARWHYRVHGLDDPGATEIGLPGEALPDPPVAALRAELKAVPPEMSVSTPASRCDGCGRPLGLIEKLPVIGWILTQGRCKTCGFRVPTALPLAEAAIALGSLGLALWLGWTPELLPAAMVLVWLLVTLALADHLHQVLPDALTLPGIWIGIVLAALGYGLVPVETAVLGAAGGFCVMRLFQQGWAILAGGHGLGGGDVMLIALLGSWVGWQPLPMIVALGAVLAIVIGMLRFAFKDPGWRQIRFGPALALAGAWAALLQIQERFATLQSLP